MQTSRFCKEKRTKNETFKILAMSWQIEEKLKLDEIYQFIKILKQDQ